MIRPYSFVLYFFSIILITLEANAMGPTHLCIHVLTQIKTHKTPDWAAILENIKSDSALPEENAARLVALSHLLVQSNINPETRALVADRYINDPNPIIAELALRIRDHQHFPEKKELSKMKTGHLVYYNYNVYVVTDRRKQVYHEFKYQNVSGIVLEPYALQFARENPLELKEEVVPEDYLLLPLPAQK